jgi:hypothetical protein
VWFGGFCAWLVVLGLWFSIKGVGMGVGKRGKEGGREGTWMLYFFGCGVDFALF